jgi:hypothetical protein
VAGAGGAAAAESSFILTITGTEGAHYTVAVPAYHGGGEETIKLAGVVPRHEQLTAEAGHLSDRERRADHASISPAPTASAAQQSAAAPRTSPHAEGLQHRFNSQVVIQPSDCYFSETIHGHRPRERAMSTADKQILLRQTNLGQRTAEEEKDQLARYFVETEYWRKIYAGDIDIVYGNKGTGKSAIYLLILDHENQLFDRGILLTSGENVRGAPVFQDLSLIPPLASMSLSAFGSFIFLRW